MNHFRDDLPSQSFDWCKLAKHPANNFSTNHLTDIDKTKHNNYNQQQHENLNNHARKLMQVN